MALLFCSLRSRVGVSSRRARRLEFNRVGAAKPGGRSARDSGELAHAFVPSETRSVIDASLRRYLERIKRGLPQILAEHTAA